MRLFDDPIRAKYRLYIYCIIHCTKRMAFASHASLATPRLTGRVEDLERKYAQRVREAKSSIEELKEGSLLFQSAGKP